MFGLGLPELIVIFLVIFLLFGPRALPQMAKDFGKFLRLLKEGAREVHDEAKLLDDEKEQKGGKS